MNFSCKPLKSILFLTALTACLYLLAPYAEALASGPKTIGESAKHVSGQMSPLPKLISVICYVIGVYFAVRGLFALKGFIEKPDDNPITRTLGLLSVSALLIMLPYSLHLVKNTFKMQTGKIESAASAFSTKGDD